MNPNSSFGGFSFGGGAPSFGAPTTTAASSNLSFGGLGAPPAASAG